MSPPDEAERFARDRALFRAHSATFLVGLAGWLIIVGLTGTGLLVPVAGGVLLVLASVTLVVSGILALKLGRTLSSNRFGDNDGLLESDPYVSDGDALIMTQLLPGMRNASSPSSALIIGIIALALSSWWLVAALMPG